MKPDPAPVNDSCHCDHGWDEHRVSAYGQTCAVSCDGKDYGEDCFCVRWIALDKVPAAVRSFNERNIHPLQRLPQHSDTQGIPRL